MAALLVVGVAASGPVLQKASQAQAEAGTENSRYMTALRTAQAIAALASSGGTTNNVTLTGANTIRTNLLVDASGSGVRGGTNILEVQTVAGLKALQVGTNALAYFSSNIVTDVNSTVGGVQASYANIKFQQDLLYLYPKGADNPAGRAQIQSQDLFGSADVTFFTVHPNQSSYGVIESYAGGGLRIGTGAYDNPVSLYVNRIIRAQVTTNGVQSSLLISTNGVLVATNYLAANMTPVPGFISLVGSNNVLYIVTTTTTNRIP